uniref:cyclic AMP-dependent transcription factor ATF-7-like n=1 Tax=Myxine glutinosa TaxID=7769 RepID=UPI00358F65AA
MNDEKPFVCDVPNCGQSFTNEDHLAVHKHKHEMTLKFGPPKNDYTVVADQTPTPTRFLRNCEEVGLFHELASPFEKLENEFKKTQEDDDDKKMTADFPAPSLGESSSRKSQEPAVVRSSLNCEPVVQSNRSSLGDKDGGLAVNMEVASPSRAASLLLSGEGRSMVIEQALPSPASPLLVPPPAPSSQPIPPFLGSLPIILQLPNGQSVPVAIPVSLPTASSPTLTLTEGFPKSNTKSQQASTTLVPNIPGIPGPVSNSTGSMLLRGSPVPGPPPAEAEAAELCAPIPGPDPPAGAQYNGAVEVLSQALEMVMARQEVKQQQLSPVLQTRLTQSPSPSSQPQITVESQHSPPASIPSSGSSSSGGGGGRTPPASSSTRGRRRRCTIEDPEERRRRFLERNRAAASRCRQKRKAWVTDLEHRAEDMAHTNGQLQNEVKVLRSELSELKRLLLAHKDCPVTATQKEAQIYLSNMNGPTDGMETKAPDSLLCTFEEQPASPGSSTSRESEINMAGDGVGTINASSTAVQSTVSTNHPQSNRNLVTTSAHHSIR